jgi:hypothetical protein
VSNTRIIKTNLKTTLTEHPHTSLATTMMVSERNQVGLLYSTASRLIKNGKMQRIIIGLVSMGLILRSFDVMFLVDSSSHAALDRLVDDVGDSNRGTTSNLNKEDAATDLINAADTALFDFRSKMYLERLRVMPRASTRTINIRRYCMLDVEPKKVQAARSLIIATKSQEIKIN